MIHSPASCSRIFFRPCLSNPEVPCWVSLSHVVWLTKIMLCQEHRQPVCFYLSPVTVLQLWLCDVDPQQRQQQQGWQFLLILSNSFFWINAVCTNAGLLRGNTRPSTMGKMWDLNNFWDCAGVWRMLDKLTNNTSFANKGCNAVNDFSLQKYLIHMLCQGGREKKQRKLTFIVWWAISKEARIRSGKCHFNAPVLFQQNTVWELAASTTRFSQ